MLGNLQVKRALLSYVFYKNRLQQQQQVGVTDKGGGLNVNVVFLILRNPIIIFLLIY